MTHLIIVYNSVIKETGFADVTVHTTYGMDTSMETNEILAFGMTVYSRYIYLAYVRIWNMSDIYLIYA